METMTFLNTDIEGSTSLLRRVGDQVYATILEDHHRIIREQLAAHDGSEHGTAGDSFFAVFTSPSSCVNAVVAMQTALQSFAWPGGETVRVRMGIHTGEVSQNETGFVGYEVHRAARISAIGHGGQVLLSSSTASLVEDTLSSGLSIKPLGSHRLKDLGRPEAISQLVFPGAESDFPALRSLDNPELPNNLPTSLNDFVGRESDLQEIRSLINEARLVTLTGAGGSGKTRLALQVAAGLLDASRDGIWFIELAPVNDPAQVPQAIISALSLSSDGDKSAVDLILSALKEQNAVFVIDNCEHLVEAVADLLDVILRQCPKVRLLATSREPLGVSGEEVYRVRSLTVPESGVQSAEELLGADAATLFVQRGRSIDKSFQATDANASLIASICRRLDGIPLAIELAAARLSSMSIEDLHQRLDQRFRLLTGGSRNVLPRQQTLGAMVAWSYDLLNDNEKTVLRRLTVFVNGFDLRAAENVCSTETIDEFDIADILGSLVNKSLVIAERNENSLRYRLLETIRQYAADQLLQTGGESEMLEARMRHAHSYLALCEKLYPPLRSHGQAEALKQMDLEQGNVEAALNTFSINYDDRELLLRLATACAPHAIVRGHKDAIPFLRELASRTPADDELFFARTWTVMTTHLDVVAILNLDGNFPDLQESLHKALAVHRAHGNKQDEAQTCLFLDTFYRYRLEFTREEDFITAAYDLAESLGDKRLQARALLLKTGDMPLSEQKESYEKVLKLYKEVGDAYQTSYALYLINLHVDQDDPNAPQRHYQLLSEALTLAESVDGYTMIDLCQNHLGLWLCALEEWEKADDMIRRSVALSIRLGRPIGILAWAALYSGWVSTAWGNLERGIRLTTYCLKMFPVVDVPIGYLLDKHEIKMMRSFEERQRAAVGDDRFEELRREGEALSFDELVALLKTPSV